MAGAPCSPGASSALKFVPATCLVTDLRYAVECARESQDPAPLVVVMLHPHDFVDLDPAAGRLAFGELLELWDWLAAQDDVQLRTIGQVAEQERDLGIARYREYCTMRPDLPSRLLPSALEGLGRDVHYYPTRATLANVNLWRLLRIGVFYGGIGLNGFLMANATSIHIRTERLARLRRGEARKTVPVPGGLLASSSGSSERLRQTERFLPQPVGHCAWVFRDEHVRRLS